MARKGKYTDVVKTLDKLPPADQNYQSRVDEQKRVILEDGPKGASFLALHIAQLRRQKDELDEQEKALNLLLEAYTQLAIEQFECEAITSVTLEDGSVIRIEAAPTGRVIDKALLRAWAMKNGMENDLTLHPSKVDGLVKQLLLDGEKIPDGTEAFVRHTAKFIK